MKFRFETLLKTRKHHEALLQKEMAEITSHLQSQNEKLQFMLNIADERKRDRDKNLGQPMDMHTLNLYENFFTGVGQETLRQQKIIAEITTRLDEKRQQVIQAARKRRTLEFLKDREIFAHKKEQKRIETEQLNEAAINQWRQNMAGNPR